MRFETVDLLASVFTDLSPFGGLRAIDTMYLDAVGQPTADMARIRGFTISNGNRRIQAADYYIGEVIQQLARNGANDAETRRALIDAARRIRSDYYRGESLKALLRDADMREADLLDLVTAAAALSSDHYKADVLTAIVQHAATTARVRDAVTTASDKMSQHYRDAVRRAAGK